MILFVCTFAFFGIHVACWFAKVFATSGSHLGEVKGMTAYGIRQLQVVPQSTLKSTMIPKSSVRLWRSELLEMAMEKRETRFPTTSPFKFPHIPLILC
jgi:hypothetical protein